MPSDAGAIPPNRQPPAPDAGPHHASAPLIEIVDQFLAEDGVFVISGIIDTKEKEIADKLNAYGFDVIETRRMKDWVSMTAKMR